MTSPLKTSSFHNSTAILRASPAPGSVEESRINPNSKGDRATLAAIARQAMIERGREPDFPPTAQQELAAIGRPADATDDVGDHVRVKLVHTDVERGFIDFVRD